jgi:hypothetical protein
MSSNESRKSRLATSLLALVATCALGALIAAPAGAFSATGSAVFVPANHDKGRTLSGQNVKLLVGNGGSSQDNKLTLPVAEVNPVGSQPTATSAASLTFKKGKASVVFSDVRFNLSAATIAGKLAGTETSIFRVEGAPQVNPVTGAVSLAAGKLRLIGTTAQNLKAELNLERALNPKGVGMVWLAAQAKPTHVAKPITSGSVNWGVLASWRKYVLGQQGPPPSTVGAISVAGGATSTGTLSEPNAYFSFPVSGGSFEQGLFGASDKLHLTTQGSVKFEKPAHCIIEVSFSNVGLTIGTASTLSLNSMSNIDTPPTCADNPPAVAANVPFATLGTSGIAPSYSAGGKTVTWSAVPATLTAAGSTAWGAGPPYIAGKALDPVTITVGLG